MLEHSLAHISSLSWWGTSRIGKKTERSSGLRQADGQRRMVCRISNPVSLSCPCRSALSDVHFLETSSLTGDNVEAPFLLAVRAILLAIESGALDPEKAGSGVSYGDRALRRVNSSSRLSFGSLSGNRRKGIVKLKVKSWIPGRKCC
jgi:hypothetical protein